MTILLLRDRNVVLLCLGLVGIPWRLPLLTGNPKKKKVDYLPFLLGRERAVQRHLPPFVQTAPTAHGARVHGNEDWMTTHRRLSPIIGRDCRSQALVDKIARMPTQSVRSNRL